ncbi:MAG TPA: hypothetical protein VFL61_01510 [Gaiellaceae bacterium]|nr:hypothetical protein [Gaiellaceae bacterium]
MKPSSFPRSAGIVRSASCAVAATNDTFHPSPRPKSRTAVMKTPSNSWMPAQDTAITVKPVASARVRPMRSITGPITSTSAYMPSTCAPMIGKMRCCAWWRCSTTT